MSYLKEEYPISITTNINLCNNIKNIAIDSQERINRESIDSLSAYNKTVKYINFANEHKLSYKYEDQFKELQVNKLECNATYLDVNLDMDLLKKDCLTYIRKQISKVLSKQQATKTLIQTEKEKRYTKDYISQLEALTDPDEIIEFKDAERDSYSIFIDGYIETNTSLINEHKNKIKEYQTKLNKIAYSNAELLNKFETIPEENTSKINEYQTLIANLELQIEDLYWQNYSYSLTKVWATQLEDLITTYNSIINSYEALLKQELNFTITACIKSKFYAPFYVMKRHLEKYGHIAYWNNLHLNIGNTQYIFPYENLCTYTPDIIYLNEQCSSIIKIRNQRKVYTPTDPTITTTSNFEEEFYVEDKEDFLITIEFPSIYLDYNYGSLSYPIYLTSKDCPSLQELEQDLDLKFHSSIPIIQNNSYILNKDELQTLILDKLNRILYVNQDRIKSSWFKECERTHEIETDFDITELTLDNYINNLYINFGIPLTTTEYSSIYYLYSLFKSFPQGDKDLFDEYLSKIGTTYLTNPVPYINERQIIIKNSLYETIIKYSYIEEETESGDIECTGRHKGNIGNATIEAVPDESKNIPYAKDNRNIHFSRLGSYPSIIHGIPISINKSYLEIKVQTDKNEISILKIHGLNIETTYLPAIPLKPREDSQWMIFTYKPPGFDSYTTYRKDTFTSYFNLSNLSGCVIPLANHDLYNNRYKDSNYSLLIIDRMCYEACNLNVITSLTDDQRYPYFFGKPDPWIPKESRQQVLEEITNNFLQDNTFKNTNTIAYNINQFRYKPLRLIDKDNESLKEVRTPINQDRLSKDFDIYKPNDFREVLVSNIYKPIKEGK